MAYAGASKIEGEFLEGTLMKSFFFALILVFVALAGSVSAQTVAFPMSA